MNEFLVSTHIEQHQLRAQNPDLDERDMEILTARKEAYDKIQGPRVGDFVVYPDPERDKDWREFERQIERFSHDWGENIQTSPGGSFHLAKGYVSFSGALNPGMPKGQLLNSGQARIGRFWFFHHDYARAHNGVDVQFPCRVYVYDPEPKEEQTIFEQVRQAIAPEIPESLKDEDWFNDFNNPGSHWHY